MATLTTLEAAKRSSLTDARIRQLLWSGVVKGQKFGKLWAVDVRSLDAYLKKERRPGRKPLVKRLCIPRHHDDHVVYVSHSRSEIAALDVG